MSKLIFPANVEVGQYYLVPHIFVHRFYGEEDAYIPINTPPHEDKEYIKFPDIHWHIDWRFLKTRCYNRIAEGNSLNLSRNEVAFIVTKFITGSVLNTDGKIVYKRVKCKRTYNSHKFHKDFAVQYHLHWPAQLQAAFCGKELKRNDQGQYVCPHKGAIIDLKYVDEFGNAVCPAHLLRFDPTSLKAIDKLEIPNELKNLRIAK